MASAKRKSSLQAKILLGIAIPVAPAALVAGGLPAVQIYSLMCGGLLVVGAGMIALNVREALYLLRTFSHFTAVAATPEGVHTAFIRAFCSFLFTSWVLSLSALFGLLTSLGSFAWLAG